MLLTRELPKIASRKCNGRTRLYLQAPKRTSPPSADLVEGTSQDSSAFFLCYLNPFSCNKLKEQSFSPLTQDGLKAFMEDMICWIQVSPLPQVIWRQSSFPKIRPPFSMLRTPQHHISLLLFWGAGQNLGAFTRQDPEEETEKFLVYELHGILGTSWVLKGWWQDLGSPFHITKRLS